MSEAVALLQEYGIVKGDPSGDLGLDRTITRAEAATIFVRAMGAEDLAKMLVGTAPFDDLKNHWASGYVSAAFRLGLMKGRSETQFDPDAQITNAEVYTVLLRLVEREPVGPWNPVAIMRAAGETGIAPDAPLDILATLPALRGQIFESLGKAISTVPLKDGSTVLKKHVDRTPPVLSVTAIPATTAQASVTVTGTALDATSVKVNGQAASLTGTSFTAQIELAFGANALVVVAKDRAGNEASQTLTITRSGTPATIKVTGPTNVKAGATVNIVATPYDANGNVLPTSMVTATVGGNIGTYDVATGTFRAGANAGKGTIAFVAGAATATADVKVLGLASNARSLAIRTVNPTLTVSKSGKVEVEVLDEEGNPLTYDDGRSVTLRASGLEGVTVTPTTALTVAGVATFNISGNTAGEATLEATSGSLASGTGHMVFTTNVRVVLTATPSSGKADGSTSSSIRATLQDESGNPVTNTSDSDISIRLSTGSTSSTLTNSFVTIRRNTSSSTGFDGSIVPGYDTETVRITGEITSGHRYTVVPTSVSFSKVAVGSASRFDISGGGGTYLPGAGTVVNLSVYVTDSNENVITTGEYGFQVEVSTTNDEALVDGVPSGLSLEIGDTGQTPIVGAKYAVVGRTVDGRADLKLRYDKSGKVTLKVVGVRATDTAYDDEGTADKASSSSGFHSEDKPVTFVGATAGLRLTVDLPSANLYDQPFGVLSANSNANAKIKVYVVDAAGGWIPNAGGTATLTKVSGDGTRVTTTSPARVINGVAEFNIVAKANEDIDTYEATATVVTIPDGSEPTVRMYTYKTKPEKPSILSITGEGGDLNRVRVSDTYMEIQLANHAAGERGYVKVYRSGSSTAIYTSDVLDLSAGPYVRVPKKVLPNSSEAYTVVVNNGYADSVKSDPWPSDSTQKVINEQPITVNISSVKYDAATETLTVYASNISSGGVIDPSLLTVRKSTAPTATTTLSGATCTATSGKFTCTNVVLPADEFYGSVLLDTEDGWYLRSSNGQSAEADETLTDNYIYPMGHITHAAVSFTTDTHGHVTGTLTLYGTNLNQGKVYLDQILINGDTTMALGRAGEYVSPTSSTSVSISIPDYHDTAPASEASSVAARMKEMAGPAVTLLAKTGWLRDGSSNKSGELIDVPVFATVDVTGVRYKATAAPGDTTPAHTIIITGKGFTGATIDPDNLLIQNRAGGQVVALSDATATVVIVDDHTIEIRLSDYDEIETVANNGNIFLTSRATSLNGTPGNAADDVYWYRNASGWYGMPLADRKFRLRW